MSRKQEHVMKKKKHRKIKEPRDRDLKTHGEERFEEREYAPSSNVLPHYSLRGLYPYSNVTSEESKAQNGC